ncbi:TlpA disulfide reductase family protein [uncultured Sunxiuqinia sp.]|uniref:TlpA family protein disulfide reductase n=1 Tax=uncultured Sunxiuqinia sp. TaxID=1573825 RepID=UPI002625243E|nr:TlpA disulfide reductase family protein [uncultured Sunxiuqinia sp.]
MKNQLLILTSIFFLAINISCNKPTNSIQQPKEVTITGQVINKHNYDPKTIVIIINDVASGEQIKFLDDLDEKGNFEIKFERYYPQEVMLKYFSIWEIFVHPGDSIHIELDAEKMKSNETIYNALTFSGDAITENQQLSAFNAWFSPIRKKESQSRVEESRYNFEMYKQYRDSLRNEYQKESNEFIKANKISEPIKTWIYYEIEHDYIHNLVNYPRHHRQLNNYEKSWDVPVDYYDFFIESKLNSRFIANAHFAKSFLNEFFIFYVRGHIRQELITKGLVKDTIFPNGRTAQRWLVENIDSVIISGIDKLTPDEIKQYMLSNYFIMKQRQNSDTETYEEYLPLINKEIKEPFLLANLKKNYEENKKLEKSPQSNRKKIFDAEDNLGTEILKKIISDNKGKVIYIDCWAIWCGPCIAEMPNSKKLMTELNNEKVEFVFLCCNSPADAGKKKVEDLKLGGTHYFLNQDQTNYIQKELAFSSYPNYVLIDKKGNIVTSSPFNSPSNIETKKKILELINE